MNLELTIEEMRIILAALVNERQSQGARFRTGIDNLMDKIVEEMHPNALDDLEKALERGRTEGE